MSDERKEAMRERMIGNAYSKGHKHSEEWLAAQKEWSRGHKVSDEQKKKTGDMNRGKTFSPEVRRKMREAALKDGRTPPSNKGRKFPNRKPMSDEARKKSSEARKGQIPWNKGKKGVYSEEALEKMKNAAQGRVVTDETKAKIRGQKRSEEVKERMSKALSGKAKSPEHIQSLKDAWVIRKLNKGTAAPNSISKKRGRKGRKRIQTQKAI